MKNYVTKVLSVIYHHSMKWKSLSLWYVWYWLSAIYFKVSMTIKNEGNR